MSDKFKPTTWAELKALAGKVVEVRTEGGAWKMVKLGKSFEIRGHNNLYYGVSANNPVNKDGVPSSWTVGVETGFREDRVPGDSEIVTVAIHHSFFELNDGLKPEPPAQVRLAENVPADVKFSYQF